MSRNGHLAHAPFSDSPSFVDSCLFNTTRKKKSADLRVFFIYLKIEMGKRYMNLKKLFQDKSFSCCRARSFSLAQFDTSAPEKIFEPFK
jgi:hypothetical protein